jgi:hypothetical protein
LDLSSISFYQSLVLSGHDYGEGVCQLKSWQHHYWNPYLSAHVHMRKVGIMAA